MPELLDHLVAPAVGGLILLTLALLVGVAIVMGMLRSWQGPQPLGIAVIQGWMSRLPSLLAWFLLMLVLIRGLVQVLAFAEPGTPVDTELMRVVLTTGSWGYSWMIEAATAFALLALMWLFAGKSAQYVALSVPVMLLVLAESGIGHGADAIFTPAILGRLIHALHLLGAGIWFGTLAILALTVFPNLGSDEPAAVLTQLLHSFSRRARLGVSLLVGSGAAMTWFYSTTLLDLPSSEWGKLLLIKLAVTSVMLALGGYNWLVLTPHVAAGTATAPSRLRRAIVAEVLLGLLVLGVTALLVRLALPIDAG